MTKKNIITRSKRKRAFEFFQNRQHEAANAAFAKVCTADRTDAESWMTWGVVAGMLGRHEQAIERLRRASELRPGHAGTWFNLGIALRSVGHWEDALAAFQEAVRLDPRFSDAQDCLAHALISLNRLDQAIVALEYSLNLRPENAEMRSNLGSIYQAKGHLQEAETCYREAIRTRPHLPIAVDNLGSVLTAQGKLQEAIAIYREALGRHPRHFRAASNLLLTLNYVSGLDPHEVYREHCSFEMHLPVGSRPWVHRRSSETDRRLRVGYVSPDFREHSVAYFIAPILSAHNRTAFEIACYSDVPRPDGITERLRSLADIWRPIAGWTDERLAEQIRADQVDILVDLAGHTAANRLPVFARRPAPVQVTYLGYPNTTGLAAMDYRIADGFTDPDGCEKFYTETIVRLPGCFLCYQPPAEYPDIGRLPFERNSHITFGSFNNLAKLQPEAIAVWAKILRSITGSKLIVKNPSLGDVATRDRLAQTFAAHGVQNEDLILRGPTSTSFEHLSSYSEVDIALDTFPYGGTTTTCEAMWMGVPVVTVEGSTHAGRVGASLLRSVGLDAFIAEDSNAYVERAVRFARDQSALSDLRSNLRNRMQNSSLCDASRFTKDLEHAFREMWRHWCIGS